MVESCCGTIHPWIRNHMSARIVIQGQYTVAILPPFDDTTLNSSNTGKMIYSTIQDI